MSTNAQTFSYSQLLRDFRRFSQPYRGRFWLGSLLRLSSDIVYLYTAFALAGIIDFFTSFTPGSSLARLWFLLISWVATFVFVVIVRQAGRYFCYQAAEGTKLNAELIAIKHVAQLEIAWHEKENSGNKLKRIENGGDGFNRLTRIWVDQCIELVVNFVGMTIILALTDVRVAGMLLLFIVTHIAIATPLSRFSSAAARVVNQHEENFSGLTFELLSNIRSVKVMGLFPRLAPFLEQQAKAIFLATKRRARRFRSKAAVQGLWAYAFRVAGMVMIIHGIIQGRFFIGFLILFNAYFTVLRTSIEEITNLSDDIIISRYNIARLHAILDEPIPNEALPGKRLFPHNWQTISLRNVSFAYGATPVLRNISFDIRRGEKIGIVGLSGAGKSTLFKLLLKEYENFSGDILFDDLSIRDIKKDSYFERVAIVLQDTEVFNFSLEDNITIAGSSNVSREERLRTAVATAHVNDFVTKLPHGLTTLIGEKGVKLSGGEKQRVGIARAIYKQPDILFLDEATSHLDLESEEKIKDSLHQFFQNVTAVVIAHRLTTIQEMDRILLIEGGELLEEGTFKALQKKQGRFFELWQKQRL